MNVRDRISVRKASGSGLTCGRDGCKRTVKARVVYFGKALWAGVDMCLIHARLSFDNLAYYESSDL